MTHRYLEKPFICTVLILACCGDARLRAQDHEDGDPNEEFSRETTVAPVEIGVGGNIKRENPYQSEVEQRRPFHAHLLWESRYVTEGRDNLQGDALASLSSDVSIGNFTFAPWLARGYESDYTELNLNFVYGLPLTEQLEVYGGYTYLQARLTGENAYDNEVSLDMVYRPTPLFDLLGGYYYSFEAQGGFGELGVLREQALHEKVVLTLRGILGINDGYVVEGHNGFNHVQFRLGAAFYPIKRLEVLSYGAYNFAIDRDPERYSDDLTLGDFFWGGVGVVFHF